MLLNQLNMNLPKVLQSLDRLKKVNCRLSQIDIYKTILEINIPFYRTKILQQATCYASLETLDNENFKFYYMVIFVLFIDHIK
jgi:hypothetical protein